MKYFPILLAIPFCLIPFLAMSQDNCKLKKDEDGIKVFTCDESDSKFKSLRVETSFSGTSLDQLKAFLLDAKNYVKWQYNMIESKMLDSLNEHEIVVRSVVHAPWPVTNREMITHVNVSPTDHPDIQIIVKSIPSEYPLEKGLVRVPFSEAKWNVKKVGDELVIQYSLSLDPGGSVPAWLVNIAMTEGPYTTFKNLKNQLPANKKQRK